MSKKPIAETTLIKLYSAGEWLGDFQILKPMHETRDELETDYGWTPTTVGATRMTMQRGSMRILLSEHRS